MARPRVFVSSTYYDLKNVRADLERFVRERGFDPVLHERGSVAYGNEKELEEYCYEEIEQCDILVSLIGGRFGTSSAEDEPYSISQVELKRAIEIGKQVYLFIERDVLAEYRTYQANKARDDISYAAVDDIRVYRFIDEVNALPLNNQTAPFETSSDITTYLQEQWAGLFQRLLKDTAKEKEVRVLDDLRATANTLNQLVTFLTEEKRATDQTISDILLTNHPMFAALRTDLRVPYPVFFTNRKDMDGWLGARSYEAVEYEERDESTKETHAEWLNSRVTPKHLLKVALEVFDDEGRVKVVTPSEWKKEWVQTRSITAPTDQDDIPF